MPEPAPIPPPLSRRVLLGLLSIPALTAVVFTLYTQEVWEDFFITFRHTENLVKGNGLVYQVGERVHGFTSVLNTLLPALPLKLFGTLEAALNVYRVFSLATLLAGLYFLLRSLGRRFQSGFWELALIAVLVATSVKIVVFTMNGQEAGFLVGFFAMALGMALEFESPRAWLPMGLVWAGLLYTRPDSPVYIAISAGFAGWFRRGSLQPLIKSAALAAGVAAVCFAPWVIFAWSYYGSPIPHTILAKAADHVLVNDSTLATFEAMWGQYIDLIGDTFGPVYGLGGWPTLMGWGAVLGGLGASFLWVLPVKDRFARACSFALMVTIVYLTWLRVQRDAFPWYFGPASLLAILVVARSGVMAWNHRGRWGRIAGLAAVGMVVATNLTCFTLSNRSLRIQQLESEEHTRKAIGIWLGRNAAPGDTVYAECIGYVGYYSGAKILDYPGLVAPEVVKARHENHAGFGELPVILKPTWIVARRDGELEVLRSSPSIVAAYDWAKEFDSREAIASHGHFSGEGTAIHDAWFVVLRRKPGM